MMRRKQCRGERGVALLLAIFALLLITSIALAMLYSSDTETNIAVNYRDKQIATYAALSALQEARDRIQPITGDLPSPVGLPGVGTHQVIYIINPKDGEVIAPWDGTPDTNPYFDTELCHENILGLTGTPGVPCTTVPGGADWRKVYDNSAGTWQLKDPSGNPLPLDYKWVRISLKADNNTNVVIADGSGKQVCWDGAHQVQKPTVYDTVCLPPIGEVTEIIPISPGAGYSTGTFIEIDPPGAGGRRATGVPVLETTSNGSLSAVTRDTSGSGYTSTPAVTITGDGTGATAKAIVTGRAVTAVTVLNASPAACYAAGSLPNVTFTGDGVPATGIAVVSGTACIYSFAINGTCSGTSYKNKTVTISSTTGGSGSGFSGNVQFDANGVVVPATARVINPGSYTAMPSGSTDIKCDNGQNTYYPNYQFLPGVHINSVTIVDGGEYLSAPSVSFTGAPFLGVATTGTGTLAPAGADFGTLKGLVLTNAGANYTTAGVTITGGGGTGATGHATISSTTQIKGFAVTDGGTGYTTPPIVKIIDPGGGSGAQAEATLGSGTFMGPVYLLTSLAYTRKGNGARAMAQMEVGQSVDSFSLQLGGAITLGGPSPFYGTPNSEGFIVNGEDANSCGEDPLGAKPAIGVYDDPNNPTSPTALKSVLDALGKSDNYIGAHSAPDVENVFNSLGGTPTPSGVDAVVQSTAAVANQVVTGPVTETSLLMGTTDKPIIDVVNGDLTIAGNTDGYGVLVVTGKLTFQGNFTWHGLVLVIGEGAAVMNGGGNAQITGALFVANTNDGTATLRDNLGSPSVDWTGGGGNGVQYDHCWADNLLKKIPFRPPPSKNPLRVLSVRTLPY